MSKPVKMTALWVENYRKPGLSPSDTESGLRLYVAKSGRKSWVRFYRHHGKLVKQTLPYMSLADARLRVAKDRNLQSQGIDPIQHARAQKQAAIEKAEGTLAAIVKTYLDLTASKLRSRHQYEGVLKRHVLPRLGERQVASLKRSEIVAALDKVESESGPSAADMALAVLSTVLSWHEKRSDTFRSPIIKGMRRVNASERARDRILSDDELRAVWNAASDERIGLYGRVVRFMILTGARRTEAAGLRHSEIETVRDNGSNIVVWRLPAARSKSKREVVKPLSRAAIATVDDVPRIGDCVFVFSLNGNRAMSMNRQGAKELLDQLAEVADWRLHDLRRVFRSLLSRCRVPFEIAERLLGHATPLLAKTYDRHSHLPAMLEAVEKVAAEVARIVAGEREGKVIRLR